MILCTKQKGNIFNEAQEGCRECIFDLNNELDVTAYRQDERQGILTKFQESRLYMLVSYAV